MAYINQNGTGSSQASAAQTSFEQVMTISNNSNNYSIPLLTRGMPRVQAYIIQTTGAVGSSVTLQFSVSDAVDGAKQWFDVSLPSVANLNNPLILPYTLSCKFVRLKVMREAGQATVMNVVLMAAM